MGWLITKYLITATVIVAASELAKRNDKLGALIVALPTVTILAMIWLYVEKQPSEKIANHAWYTFWYVLPTLPMFLLFPMLMQRYSFWLSLLISSLITVICFWLFSLLLKRFLEVSSKVRCSFKIACQNKSSHFHRNCHVRYELPHLITTLH